MTGEELPGATWTGRVASGIYLIQCMKWQELVFIVQFSGCAVPFRPQLFITGFKFMTNKQFRMEEKKIGNISVH